MAESNKNVNAGTVHVRIEYDVDDISEKVGKNLEENFASLQARFDKLGASFSKQTNIISKRYTQSTSSMTAVTKKTTGNMGAMLGKLGAIFAAVFATKKIVEFGAQCLELGSDLQEVQNVVDVTFPAMRKQLNDWAADAIHTAGLSETMAKQFSGAFGTMAKAMGISETESFKMSTSLSQLAGDVASFYNLSQEEAFNKLKGVFTGESEALKSLGVIMTQTALDQYAMNNGLGKTTAKMTEQEKALLRYQYVMHSLSAAQGDFARTSWGWANQTRLLSLQFEQLKATIGQGLINALTPVLQVINALIAKMQILANEFAELTGKWFGKQETETTGAVAENIGGVTTGLNDATTAAGKAKKALGALNIDQFNKLGSSDSGGGSGSSGGVVSSGASAVKLPAIDTTEQQKNVGKLKEAINDLWKKVQENKYYREMVADMNHAWENYGEPLIGKTKMLAEEMKKGFKVTYENVIKPVLHELGIDFDDLWENSLRPFFSRTTEAFGMFGGWLLDAATAVQQFYNTSVVKFGPQITAIIAGYFDYVSTRIQGTINWFTGLLTFLQGVFTLDLQKIMDGIYITFVACFEKIGLDVGDKIGKILNKMVDKVNKVVRAINEIFKTNFSTLPYFQGTAAQVSTKGVTGGGYASASIPKLASGAYFEPHTPTLAMVGEGNDSEFVAPEKKLRAAVGSEMDIRLGRLETLMATLIEETKKNRPIDRPIQIDGKTVTKTVNKENAKSDSRKGK